MTDGISGLPVPGAGTVLKVIICPFCQFGEAEPTEVAKTAATGHHVASAILLQNKTQQLTLTQKKSSSQDVIIRKSIPLFLRSSRGNIWCWLPPSPHSGDLPILGSSQNGRIGSPGGVFSPYPHWYSPPTEQPTPLRDTTAHTSQLLVKELIQLINQINLWQQSPTWRDASHLTHLAFQAVEDHADTIAI